MVVDNEERRLMETARKEVGKGRARKRSKTSDGVRKLREVHVQIGKNRKEQPMSRESDASA